MVHNFLRNIAHLRTWTHNLLQSDVRLRTSTHYMLRTIVHLRTLTNYFLQNVVRLRTLGNMPRLEIGFRICWANNNSWQFAVIRVSSPIFVRIKHSVGRQSAISNCGSILSAVVMLYSVEASILTRVVMLSLIAEVLCRPSRCFIL